MPFHNGAWFPLIVTDFYGPRCSQHPFDPYSLTHILHGFFFYLVLVGIPDLVLDAILDEHLPTWWVYLAAVIIAIALAIGWEIYENSEAVIQRFRSTSGISGDYEGDSIQNSIGDVFCATSGYFICVKSVEAGVPWLPLVWFVVSEVFLALTIRDGLLLMMIQNSETFSSERIKAWQKELLDRKERENKEVQE